MNTLYGFRHIFFRIEKYNNVSLKIFNKFLIK
jgi:hypothetical protein